jgi:proteasome assembly chaperone (PAC2) family protein
MADELLLLEKPRSEELYMIVGWRQWADGGSVSSGLPLYLIGKTKAYKIGTISPDGFYIFQIPGTHDLVRPVIKFKDGYPEALQSYRNEFFYSGDQKKGVVYFLGDEPHTDIERYISLLLEAAKTLHVKRIIALGGVYGELPYNKERMVSSSYSQTYLKQELDELSVEFSDYHGGASIGSYLCKRASEQEIEFISFYAFVPTYDFSNIQRGSSTISIENDFMAWLGIMRRIDSMLKLNFDFSELEEKSQKLLDAMDAKIEEIENSKPELNVRNYLRQLEEDFEENAFHPVDDFWEEEIGRLFDKLDGEETE